MDKGQAESAKVVGLIPIYNDYNSSIFFFIFFCFSFRCSNILCETQHEVKEVYIVIPLSVHVLVPVLQEILL